MAKMKRIRIIALMIFASILLGCAHDTVRVMKRVKPGMTIEQVRRIIGDKGTSKTIDGKTYHDFGLFEDQTSKYFGMRSSYIVVIEQGRVVEWCGYDKYFAGQEPPWTPKKKEP